MVLMMITEVETGQQRQQRRKVIAARPVFVGKGLFVEAVRPVGAEIEELQQ